MLAASLGGNSALLILTTQKPGALHELRARPTGNTGAPLPSSRGHQASNHRFAPRVHSTASPEGNPATAPGSPAAPRAGGRRLRAAAARCRPRAGASRSPPAAAAYFSHSGGGGPRRDAGPGGGCRHREPRRAGVRAVHSSGKLCRRLPIGGTGTGEGLGAAERGSGRRGAAAHGGSGARCGACPGAGRAGCLAAR